MTIKFDYLNQTIPNLLYYIMPIVFAQTDYTFVVNGLADLPYNKSTGFQAEVYIQQISYPYKLLTDKKTISMSSLDEIA